MYVILTTLILILLGIGEPLYSHPWQENFRH